MDEDSQAEGRPDERRRSERVLSNKAVEFIVDADMIEGSSLDVSGSGVSITTDKPIEVELRFGTEGSFRAALVWAHKTSEGGCQYGFEYIED